MPYPMYVGTQKSLHATTTYSEYEDF